MSMAQDIAEIKWMLGRMGDPDELTKSLDAINDKLRYDIEPKLDNALGNKGKTEEQKFPHRDDPEDMCWMIREIGLNTRDGDKKSALEYIKRAANCSDDQAEETHRFLVRHCITPRESTKEAE